MSFSKTAKTMVVTTAAGALLTLTPLASATLSYDAADSSATFTHTEGFGSGVAATAAGAGTLTPRTDPKTFSPTTTYPTTPSYQFKQTQTVTSPSAGGSTVATGSVAVVNNATTVGVKVQAGTGVTQLNPKGAFVSPSTLRIAVDTFFDPIGENFTAFGPGASGIASFNIGGTVGSTAGSAATFKVHLDFLDDNYFESFSQEVGAAELGPDQMRSTIDIVRTYKRPGAGVVFGSNEFATATNGTFSALVSSSELLNAGPSEGTGQIFNYQRLRIVGYIEFQARNGFIGTASASEGFSALEEDPGTSIILPTEGGAGAAIGNASFVPGVPEPVTAGLAGMSLAALALGVLRRRA